MGFIPQTVEPKVAHVLPLAVRPWRRIQWFSLDGLHCAATNATLELLVLQLVFPAHPAAVALQLRLAVTVSPRVVAPASATHWAKDGEGLGRGTLCAEQGQALVGVQGAGGREPADGSGVQVLVVSADGVVGRRGGADARVAVAALGFLAGVEVVIEVSLCLDLVVVVGIHGGGRGGG